MNDNFSTLAQHHEVLTRYTLNPARTMPLGESLALVWGLPSCCKHVQAAVPHSVMRELFLQQRLYNTMLWMNPKNGLERLLVNGELTLFALRDLHLEDDDAQTFSYDPQLWGSKAFQFVNNHLGTLLLIHPWTQQLHNYRTLQAAAMDLKDLDLEITPAVLEVWCERMKFNYHYFQLDGPSYRHGKERDEWFKLKTKLNPKLGEIIQAVDRKRRQEMPA